MGEGYTRLDLEQQNVFFYLRNKNYITNFDFFNTADR